MEVKTKRILIGCVTVAIIILMIVYVDFQTILLNLQRISIWGIFLFSVVYTLAFIFRAFKLKLVFNGINLEPNYSIIYGAIGTGWAINELTPAKLGDFVKMEYIRQKEHNFPLSKCLCAVLVDRFIDLIILFSITCFTLLYIYLSSATYITQLNLHFFIIIGAVILFIGVLGLILLFFKTDWILSITDRISPKLKNLLEKFIVRFVEGLKDIRKDKRSIILILLYNIPTWLFESLTLVIIFYLIGFQMNIFIIMLAQIVTFFTKTIPITPGGWGVSEIVGALLLSVFYPAIPYNEILSVFILDHILRLVYVFIYGGISTIAVNFRFKEIDTENFKNSNSL
ncbi:MAG: flippase-like domain-containing protein [Candidatus Lokiarchaeota archaeon]|nr:flippase-like domain-containing protein [Candidatus Lokiarchaeota archaeon]